MSRIGVLTFLHNGNYGSSLQAYALQQVLQNMGYECEHIDYQPDVTEKALNMIRCGNSPKLLLDGSRKRRVRERQDGIQKKHQKYIKHYLNHSHAHMMKPDQLVRDIEEQMLSEHHFV